MSMRSRGRDARRPFAIRQHFRRIRCSPGVMWSIFIWVSTFLCIRSSIGPGCCRTAGWSFRNIRSMWIISLYTIPCPMWRRCTTWIRTCTAILSAGQISRSMNRWWSGAWTSRSRSTRSWSTSTTCAPFRIQSFGNIWWAIWISWWPCRRSCWSVPVRPKVCKRKKTCGSTLRKRMQVFSTNYISASLAGPWIFLEKEGERSRYSLTSLPTRSWALTKKPDS